MELGKFSECLHRLLVLLRAHSGVEVRNADAQLLCSFADQLTLLGADGMCHLGAVDAVLHHQDLQLADVVDDELLEAVREHMTSLSVGAIADVGHQVLSLEATSDAIVNTLRLTPVLLKNEIAIRLPACANCAVDSLTFTLTYRSD